jgi:hypothetical protein
MVSADVILRRNRFTVRRRNSEKRIDMAIKLDDYLAGLPKKEQQAIKK